MGLQIRDLGLLKRYYGMASQKEMLKKIAIP